MIQFNKYPHVLDLTLYYAKDLNDSAALEIIQSGVTTKDEAVAFSRFVWRMVDKMREDAEAGRTVFGRTDNRDALPDIHYEVSLHMAEQGFEDVWEQVSDEF